MWPTSAKIAQLEAKIAQDGLQPDPPWIPKSTKNVVGVFDFILRASRQRSPPKRRTTFKITPQNGSRWSFWLSLDPSWLSRWPSWLALRLSGLRLGSMWTPSWCHLGSSSRHFGVPAPSQNRPSPPLDHFLQEDRPGDLPNTFQDNLDPLPVLHLFPLGPDFKNFLGRFRFDFHQTTIPKQHLKT